MKRNDYVNAIDHLHFSKNLTQRVRAAAPVKQHFRLTRATLLAALITVLMTTSAFAAITFVRERPADVKELGIAAEDMTDAQHMIFAVSEQVEGVEIHYMELNPIQHYTFRHGMLRGVKTGYQRITEDYQLEDQQMQQFSASLEKNGRVYNLRIDYMDTPEGVISNYRSVLYKDENGEILLNATDGNSGQWPVYLNVENGQIRDALPEWTAEDFEGRIGYGDAFKGGILISTVVESDEMEDVWENGVYQGSQDAGYNLLYWFAPDAQEPVMIQVPKHCLWDIDNDTLYYQTSSGHLYRMEEDFTFRCISEYDTNDNLSDGLLTVEVNGKLGILDVNTGETFVFEDITVSPKDLDETMGYNAKRYGNSGRIALVRTQLIWEEGRVALISLGVLDPVTGTLTMLQIQNGLDGYHNGWLDENRLAVIYETDNRKLLCVYEFTE